MAILRSLEELHAYEKMNGAIHNVCLFQRGYKKTRYGKITVPELKATVEEYNLSEPVSDFDFGKVEGKVSFSICFETFYDHVFDEGHITWIKSHIAENLGKMWCFILKCAVNEPQIGTSAGYDFARQLESKLQNEIAHEHSRQEVADWYCTPSQFGHLCGFIEAAHWAIGEEWAFNEDDFDAPVDWKHFYSYLDKNALRLKSRGLRIVSVVTHIFTDIQREVKGKHRRKSTDKPANVSSSLPKLSSWRDW